eukprot:804514-Prymnesium_polylepis.1
MPTSSCQRLYRPCQRACQKTRPAVGGRTGEIRIGVGTANEGTQAPEAQICCLRNTFRCCVSLVRSS